MALEYMKITGYKDENFAQAVSGDPYNLMINPESIKWSRTIEYNEQQPIDTSSTSQKYKSTPSDSLSFDIVIDCTGVVDNKRTDLTKEIENLDETSKETVEKIISYFEKKYMSIPMKMAKEILLRK